MHFKALPIQNEKWYEIDDVQDLDIAETLFSCNETKYEEYHKRMVAFGVSQNYWIIVILSILFSHQSV